MRYLIPLIAILIISCNSQETEILQFHKKWLESEIKLTKFNIDYNLPEYKLSILKSENYRFPKEKQYAITSGIHELIEKYRSNKISSKKAINRLNSLSDIKYKMHKDTFHLVITGNPEIDSLNTELQLLTGYNRVLEFFAGFNFGCFSPSTLKNLVIENKDGYYIIPGVYYTNLSNGPKFNILSIKNQNNEAIEGFEEKMDSSVVSISIPPSYQDDSLTWTATWRYMTPSGQMKVDTLSGSFIPTR